MTAPMNYTFLGRGRGWGGGGVKGGFSSVVLSYPFDKVNEVTSKGEAERRGYDKVGGSEQCRLNIATALYGAGGIAWHHCNSLQ